jgi:hypothetical protein
LLHAGALGLSRVETACTSWLTITGLRFGLTDDEV